MELDEKKIRELINSRAKYIRTNKDIASSFIALLAYVLTVALSGIKTASLTVKLIVTVCGIIYFTIFIFSIIRSRYSAETLLSEILSCTGKREFSLAIIKNKDGRFLLKYDKRWKTYLFPYTRTKVNDSENIMSFVKTEIGIEPASIIERKQTETTKHSVSDNMTKTYLHTFYNISFSENQISTKEKFSFNKTKYKWFSIDEMKQNKSISSKNEETVRFVEQNF